MSWIEVHRHKIPWWDAPRPRRLHRHTPWTTYLDDGQRTEFCACGAVRYGGIPGWGQAAATRATSSAGHGQ